MNSSTSWLCLHPAAASFILLLTSTTAVYAAAPFSLCAAQQAAVKGDDKALYYLARCYAKGENAPQDYVTAAKYMRESAELGYPFAQNDLGVFYAKGLGLEQDFKEAAKWYRKAAEN